MKLALIAALAGAAVCLPALAQQDYPNKPLRMIIPLPPGGSVDPSGRLTAARLSQRLKQSIVVENIAGGSGVLAAETVARAAPDGYTLFFTTPSVMVNTPLMSKDLPYKVSDFAPISLVVSNPFLLTIPASLGPNTLQEFIALAKSKPGVLNYGSSGEGSPQQVVVELLKSMAGIDLTNVSYKGGGPIQTDLMAGRIQLYASAIIGVAPNIKSGKLKAIAVSTAKRSAAMPDVPTVGEVVPGYEFDTWYALFTTAKTPAPIIGRLNSELKAALSDPALIKTMADQGSDLRPSTPEQLAAIVRETTERVAPLFKKLGLAEK